LGDELQHNFFLQTPAKGTRVRVFIFDFPLRRHPTRPLIGLPLFASPSMVPTPPDWDKEGERESFRHLLFSMYTEQYTRLAMPLPRLPFPFAETQSFCPDPNRPSSPTFFSLTFSLPLVRETFLKWSLFANFPSWL